MSDQNQLEILIKIKDDLDGLKRSQDELKKLKAEADNATGPLDKLTSGFGKLSIGSIASATGIMAAATAVAAGIKAGVEYNAMLDDQTAKFEILLGNATAAKERISELNAFASGNNLEFSSVARANRLLETMTSGALAGADGMRLIGDAAAYADRPIDEVAATVGRLYNGLQNGSPVSLVTQRLAEMGVISGDVKKQLDGLSDQHVTGAQAWSIAEKELSKYSGSMDRQTHTLSGLLGIAKSGVNEFAGAMSKPIFDVFKNSLEAVLVKLGALPSETEKATKAIEDSAKRIHAAVNNITTGTKDRTRDEVAGELDATKTARDKESGKYASASTFFISTEKWEAHSAAVAAYDKKIQELQIDLAKFDGYKGADTTAETANTRIAELEKLRSQGEFVEEKNAIGNTETKFKSRGFQGGEQDEYDRLTKLRSAAGTADAIAKKNDAAQAEVTTAKAVADEYARIKASATEWAGTVEKIQSADAWATNNNQERLAMLDQETDVADVQLDQKLQLAAAAKDIAQQEAMSLRAQQEHDVALSLIAGRRRDVEKDITEEQKKQEAETKRLADEEKKRLDNINKAASIREKSQLDAIRHEIELANANPDITKKQKQEIINGLLAKEKTLLDEIIARRKLLGETLSDPREKVTNDAEIQSFENESGVVGAGTPKKQKAITNKIDQYDDAHDDTQLSAGEGISAGLMDAADQLGTVGDNIEQLFSGSIMDSVNAIGDGIYGWMTGTQSFGDALRNLGDSIFKEMLNTIIRMGVQWLLNFILIKTGIISTAAVQDTTRSTQQSKTIGSNAAITASAVPGAAATGISSFGMALIFGALAVALILAAASAFATGGAVPGGKQLAWLNDGPDGQEFVVRGAAHSKYGTGMLDDINTGSFDPSDYASAALASAPVAASGMPAAALAQAGGAAPASAGQSAAEQFAAAMPEQQAPRVNIAQFSTRNEAKEWLTSQEGVKHLVDTGSDNRGEMGIPT